MTQRYRLIYACLLLLGLLYSPAVMGQDCDGKDGTAIEREASELYSKGNIDPALSLLECLFDKPEVFERLDNIGKSNIYWLASQIYTLKRRLAKAEWAYRQMLVYRPSFSPEATDLEDLRLIHQKFIVQPKLAFYATGGLMQSFNHLRRKHELLAANDGASSQKAYGAPLPRYQLGFGFYYKLHKYWQVHAEVQLWNQAISYNQRISKDITRYNIFTDVQSGVGDTLGLSNYQLRMNNKHTAQLTYLSAPISIRFTLPLSRSIQCYIEGGGYASLLLNSTHEVNTEEANLLTTVDWASGSSRTYSNTNESVNVLAVKELFLPYSIGYLGGAGFQFIIKKKWHCHAGIRYYHGLLNITDQELRFINNTLLSYYDVPDDFSINSLSAQLSWIIPIRYNTYTIKTPKP